MSLRSLRPLGAIMVAALLWVAAGCGGSSPTKPGVTQADADDAAQQVAFALAQDNTGSIGGSGAPGTSARPLPGPNRAGTNVAMSADTTFTAGCVTWTIHRTFYNQLGTEDPSYSPITTVRMTAAARGVGLYESSTDTVSFGCSGNLDVLGLSVAQDTVITSGTRNDTLQCAFTSSFRLSKVYVYVEGAGALNNVTVLKPASSNWPISGTATWSLKIDRLRTSSRGSVERHFETTVTVTFNGTRFPDVQVTGGYRYRFDLQSGTIQRV